MRASELKTALILTLLGMILMRLVWMDLRSYVITYAPQNRYAFDHSQAVGSCRRSLSLRQLEPDRPAQTGWERPGWADAWLYQRLVLASCRNGVFHDAGFVRYNQGLLICCLVACVLLTRVMARSWVVGLIVAVALLSRGRLISANGQISGDALIALGFALWAMSLGHWLRSGSWLVYVGSYAIVAVLMTLEPGMMLMGFAPPLMLALWGPLLRRKLTLAGVSSDAKGRDVNLWKRWGEFLNLSLGPAPDAPLSGGLFRPLPDGVRPFMGQPRFQKAWQIFTLVGFLLLISVLLGQLAQGKYGMLPAEPKSLAVLRHWIKSFLSPLDRDSGLGLMMMTLALTWRSRWLPYLRPLVNLVGMAIVLSSLGAAALDILYFPAPNERFWQGTRILMMGEPVLMTLGMLAFYQMSLSLLARLDRFPNFTRFLKGLR